MRGLSRVDPLMLFDNLVGAREEGNFTKRQTSLPSRKRCPWMLWSLPRLQCCGYVTNMKIVKNQITVPNGRPDLKRLSSLRPHERYSFSRCWWSIDNLGKIFVCSTVKIKGTKQKTVIGRSSRRDSCFFLYFIRVAGKEIPVSRCT